MPRLPIEEWYYEIPICTRVYLTMVGLITVACELDVLMPYQLHYSYDLVFKNGQYWRLITTFLYFGGLNFDFLFHMFFVVRYMRMLEESFFRNRALDFFWMVILGVVSIYFLSPITTPKSPGRLIFHSSSLTFMILYIWARRNPTTRLNFLGLFTFTAPYLPFVLLGFSMLLHGIYPAADVTGLIVGHAYYFFEDVWPRQAEGRTRWLRAPEWFVFVCLSLEGLLTGVPAGVGGARGMGDAELPARMREALGQRPQNQNHNQQQQQQPLQQQ